MQTINNIADLKDAIQLLEVEQAANGQILKEQFYLTYESLKPVNLFKSTLSEAASSPFMLDNVISTLVGLSTGYLSRKIVVGASGNVFRKLIGSVLQLGVTNTVRQNPETVKSIGQFLFQQIFRKKEQHPNEAK